MLIKIDDIDFSYQSSRTLDNISFEVKKGDFLGIMGPNGSGKTTLLKCISNILSPQTGTVLINGNSIKKLSKKEIAKNIGVVPQTSNIDFSFRVSELVLMGRSPHIKRFESEKTKDFEIVEKVMELTNIMHLADRTFDELSGGEKQRVIIARALVQEPKLLLLDEPTVHLDINNQFEILNLVKRLSKEKEIIVISVFHDLSLAAQYSKNLILLDKGKIVSMGIPEEVLTPENIQETYNIEVIIKKHPITNALYITPYFFTKDYKKTNKTIHVICGGGSGSDVMKLLLDKGFNVTTGVLSIFDSDFEAAKNLRIPVIGEIPFSQITNDSYNANVKLIKESSFVIVTEFQVGPGNLKNIEAVETALDFKVPVVFINSKPISQKDFIEGNLKKCLEKLKEKGAIFVESTTNALKILLEDTS